MDFGYLRGRYVAGGIELCLEPKRGGVKAKLSLKDALGKKNSVMQYLTRQKIPVGGTQRVVFLWCQR